MSAGFERLVDRLVAGSRDPELDPYRYLEWPDALPAYGWCMPPELISLHGMPVYDTLDAAARRELSRLELIQFFSLNIHGETRLMAGLEARLARAMPAPVAAYLAHFHQEEEKHRACFVEFCERYGKGAYGDRNVEFPADWSAEEAEFVFFARVLMFEGLVDHCNALVARDGRVVDIVRQINRAHHLEEARHLAFGRAWLRELAGRFARNGLPAIPDRIVAHLRAFRTALWREFFNPDVYRDAALADPIGLRHAALAGPAAEERRDRLFAATDRFFARIGCPLQEAAP